MRFHVRMPNTLCAYCTAALPRLFCFVSCDTNAHAFTCHTNRTRQFYINDWIARHTQPVGFMRHMNFLLYGSASCRLVMAVAVEISLHFIRRACASTATTLFRSLSLALNCRLECCFGDFSMLVLALQLYSIYCCPLFAGTPCCKVLYFMCFYK